MNGGKYKVYKKSTLKSDKYLQKEALDILEKRLNSIELQSDTDKIVNEFNKKMQLNSLSDTDKIIKDFNKKMRV